MFTKIKNKLVQSNDAGRSRKTVTYNSVMHPENREAPWLGRNFFGVMLSVFGFCVAMVVVAVVTGNFR